MAARTPIRPAEVPIDRVLEEFLEEQRARLAASTFRTYDDVVHLLRDYLNGYDHLELSAAENAFYDRHFNAKGKDHREFCELFGPEKLLESFGGFLGYFMVRKVMAGADFKRSAGTVTRKLAKWLAAKGYVAAEAGGDAAERAREATRDLPRAERAADILSAAAHGLGIALNDVADANYVDSSFCTIVRVAPGKLWLEVPERRSRRPVGPVPAPRSATALLGEGWTLVCSLARVRGTWHIVEVGNVYPE